MRAVASVSATLRRIRADDDAAVAAIIREVMTSFGASGAGFAIHDAEVGAMSAAYASARHAYFVVEVMGQVLGGAGIAPLAGAAEGVCELRKMYFLPQVRGQGLGERVLRECLAFAAQAGFHTCYLETLTGMAAAQKLYRRLGFAPLAAPMGKTGHFGCNQFFARALP